MFLLIACGSHTRIHDTPRYKEKKNTHTQRSNSRERERNIEKLESKYSIFFFFLEAQYIHFESTFFNIWIHFA